MINNAHEVFISIIIPVYNAELYLETCIDSILHQRAGIYEIVIVDDGSTDSSMNILEKYKNNEKIRIFSKKNGGVSSARNFGLNVASGDYIGFIDADDFLPDTTFTTWLRYMHDDVAMIVGKSEGYTHDGIRLPNKTASDNSTGLNCTDAINDILYFNPRYGVCDKIFIAEIIRSNNLKFDEKIANFEDLLFVMNYLYFSKNKKVIFIDNIIYNYRLSLNSATRMTLKEKHFSFATAFININSYLSAKNKKFYYHIFLKITASYISRAINNGGFSHSFINEYISLYRKNFKSYLLSGVIVNFSTIYLTFFFLFPRLVSQLRKLKQKKDQ